MKCELCGAPVKVEGKTTQYYVSQYEEIASELSTMDKNFIEAKERIAKLEDAIIFCVQHLEGMSGYKRCDDAVKVLKEALDDVVRVNGSK